LILVRLCPSLLLLELFLTKLSSLSVSLLFSIVIFPSVSVSFLILTFYFHFTIRVIGESFVFSVSILFHNTVLNLLCRSILHFSALSSLRHLNCDVLSQSLPCHSHGIHPFADIEMIMMHEDRIVCNKERNEIEIVSRAVDFMTQIRTGCPADNFLTRHCERRQHRYTCIQC
jgi:hypothetical protein